MGMNPAAFSACLQICIHLRLAAAELLISLDQFAAYPVYSARSGEQ